MTSAGPADHRTAAFKSRAYSAPMVPKTHADGAELYGHHGDATDSMAEPDDEIAGDEFFQRTYSFPQIEEPRRDEASSSSPDSSSDTEGPLSPTHMKARQTSLADTVPSPQSPAPSVAVGRALTLGPQFGSIPNSRMLTYVLGQSQGSESASTMQELNIAILGARGSGKSTFIRRALPEAELRAPTTAAITSRKMMIDGTYYIVRLLELSFHDIHIGDRNAIKWPETVDDLATPRIDGAITIYDVTSHESLAQVPEMLSQFYSSRLTSIPCRRSATRNHLLQAVGTKTDLITIRCVVQNIPTVRLSCV